jgi:hypothetical protein
VKVTVAHLRSVPGFSPRGGFCLSGARNWFGRHGLDWRGFVREGIDASVLEGTRDPLAQALVDHARSPQGASHGQ